MIGILLAILVIGVISTFYVQVKIIYILLCKRGLANCVYVAEEEKFKDDAMSSGEGYRCRYTMNYKNNTYIIVEKGRKKKPIVNNKYMIYIGKNRFYTISNLMEYIKYMLIGIGVTVVSVVILLIMLL